MTKIKNNPLLKGASGMLGEVVVYREHRGRIIMSNRPKRGGELTESQRLAKIRFMRGVQYAKAQLLDPAAKAEYEAGINDQKNSAFMVAITDYLTAPRVDLIDTSLYAGAVGNEIKITAGDDFKVVSVHVTITDNNGALIEQGAAVVQPNSFDDWRYITTAANAALPGTKVTVTVRDKPGNMTTKEKVL
jgi:hypothetical protein